MTVEVIAPAEAGVWPASRSPDTSVLVRGAGARDRTPAHSNKANMTVENPDETIERTDTGVSIAVEIKRGTGTRDQDKITGKYKAASLEEYAEEREEFLAELEHAAEEARVIGNEEPEPEEEGE